MKTSPTKRRAALLTLLCLLLLPSPSCRQTPDAGTGTNTNSAQTFVREKTTGKRGGTVTYRVTEPPKSLNALMASTEPSFLVAFFLTGGRLLEFDHDAQRYVGGLAETWQLQPDGRTVELTLRDGLKFSDGQALTTADLDFTLRAIYDERTKSFFRSALLVGEGPKPIEVKVVDPRRAQLVFPEPVAAPESFLVNVAVVPRHALQAALDAGTLGESFGVTADPKTIVTAGAFMFDQVTPGERFVLKRNPHFWKKDSAGTQLPYLDSIVVEVVADSNAALTRLREGGLDVVDRIRPTDYAAIQSAAGGVRAVDLGPGLTSDHMWFNLNEGEVDGRPKANPTKQAWFRDERFRRAVSHALDRESIARGTLQGLATPLYNFVPPSNRNWGATDIPRTDFNRERARALLQEAGFQTRGSSDAPELFDAKDNRVEFTLVVSQESEPRKNMAAAIQEDLAKVGIRVQVAPVETGELRRRFQQTFDYEAVLFGVTVSDFDPSSYSNLLLSSSPEHQWHPKQAKPATPWEARIDELVATVAREADEGRRRAAFREVQALMGEHLPVVPLFARHITCAATQRVGNYRPSPVVPFSMWNAEELFVKQ
jgi:peptide/nickel transport system substrate-binding protein